MQPSFRIVADGTDVTQRLNDRLLKLTLLDKPGMESDSLTLRLDDRDGQVALPRRGAVLEVHLGYAGEPLMRMGRFTVDTLQWAGPPDCLTVTAKAGDMRGSGKTIRSGGWEGTTLAQVCRDVGARNGWRVECPLQVAIARVDQVNESDYHFVTRLARQYDCTAKLAEGMLMVLPRQSGQSATGRRIEPLVLGRADVGSFDVTFDDRSLMRTVKTRYQLPGSGEVKSVELKNPKAPATAMGEHVDRHLYASRGEAEQAAKARLASFSRSSARVRLELPGRGDLFAERSLLLQGFKAGIDGEFLIDSVEHTYSSSGWTTVVQCNGGRGGKG
ncbi:phage late control D family protein [Pseudomonas aeruginosa]|uniref:phage late control D family protein n=1 Tax=Pseudomonas aeruginosa TaxID=287 RepID=UPI000BB579C4|nr:phage late control D family protein [Pseudomonas aeruginosa]MBH3997111.1 phage late control D family protein [Pseudomonas aeruginosa]MBH4140140.1 phage late control D family protein [Pseudomonas aeruginosa]MDG9821030.1 phage late control D family protein [Pseudomonas aeruginosa]MDG9934826.1 phage late control D family protein [Pseudomonas aeruginosa]MDH0526968.1 phage late control D family protein [Pseudomonas aeruginosa]